ncbi:MAG: sugar transferase [Desertifilum sp.]|nr:sugar transferase [Desertifilum sp.]
MSQGIYIFANDFVYHQVVALLNSIEVNAGEAFPVCIIPYDHKLDKIKQEVAARENVTLFDDASAIAFWEDYMTQAWKANEVAQKAWQDKGWSDVRRVNFVRKLCSFNGPFEKFVYMDADTLLMGKLQPVYDKLDEYDWVVNDYQYKSDIGFIYNPEQLDVVEKAMGLDYAKAHIFCAGWFASKKGVMNEERLAQLLEHLKNGEANMMSLRGSDQPLYNYLVARSGIPFYNFAYENPNATGSHWSSNFEVIDNILHDNKRPITYIHFMSISASKFNQLCAGENVNIPYQDVFLHYRYLKSPNERPVLKNVNPWVEKQEAFEKFWKQKWDNLKHKYRKTFKAK